MNKDVVKLRAYQNTLFVEVLKPYAFISGNAEFVQNILKRIKKRYLGEYRTKIVFKFFNKENNLTEAEINIKDLENVYNVRKSNKATNSYYFATASIIKKMYEQRIK